jgi:hypothetical protein
LGEPADIQKGTSDFTNASFGSSFGEEGDGDSAVKREAAETGAKLKATGAIPVPIEKLNIVFVVGAGDEVGIAKEKVLAGEVTGAEGCDIPN